MKKYFLIILLFLTSFIGFSQPVVNRSTGSNTINDPRLKIGLNAIMPCYVDTVAANANIGIDSAGAIIYTYSDQKFHYRQHNPKKWVEFANSAGSTSTLQQTFDVENGRAVLNKNDTIDQNGNDFYFINSAGNVLIKSSEANYISFLNDAIHFDTDGSITVGTSMSDYAELNTDNLSGAGILKWPNVAAYSSSTATFVTKVNGFVADATGEITLSGNFIKNQIDSAQAANFWINNTGRFGSYRDTVGTIFSDYFTAAGFGSNYDSSITNVVMTFNGSYAKDSVKGAGEGSFNNYVERNYYTDRSKWYQYLKYVPKRKNTQDYGIGLGINSTSGYITPAVLIHFITQDNSGATGKMRIYLNNAHSPTPFATTNAITINIGDTLTAEMWYNDGVVTARFSNVTLGTHIDTSYSYGYLSGSQNAPNIGKFRVNFFGGVNRIYEWRTSSGEHKGNVLFRGNSVLYGYDVATYSLTYPALIFPNRWEYDKNGGPGDRSADGVNNLSEMMSMAPSYFILALGVNDAGSSVATSTYSTNIRKIVDSMQSVGSTVILLSSTPLNSASVVPYNDTLQSIASDYGLKYIDVFSLLNNGGTSWNASYSSDNVHPNAAGHAIIAATIISEAPEILGDTSVVINRPINDPYPTTLVTYDINNGIYKSVDTSKLFTQIRSTIPTATSDGNGIYTGSGTLSGTVSVDANGNVFNMTHLLSSAFQTNANGSGASGIGSIGQTSTSLTTNLGSNDLARVFTYGASTLNTLLPSTIKKKANGAAMEYQNPSAKYFYVLVDSNHIKLGADTVSITPTSVPYKDASYPSLRMQVMDTTTGILYRTAIPTSGGSQTPWTSNIDGANYTLAGNSNAYNNQTGTTYTLVSGDNGKIVTLSNASAITLTVPTSLPAGFNCTLVQIGAGQVTITGSGTTVHNRQSFTKLKGQYAMATVVQYTTNTFITQGDME